MPFDFGEWKSLVRQALHECLAVPARYQDDSLDMPVDVTVRWHTKVDRFGDLENGGYAEVIEGINRLIFNRAQLDELGIKPCRGGEVTILATGYENVTLVLVTMEPYDGPVEEVWNVAYR